MSALLFQFQSTLIVALMIFGALLARKNRKAHVRVMSFAMAWDIILILQIELTRYAVEKAISVGNNSIMLNIHVTLAISTVILYGVMIALGRKVLSGNNHFLAAHRNFGVLTLVLRILTYITSYSAVN
jgi:uncharacterized membrane protein YozB (DUF420 family)